MSAEYLPHYREAIRVALESLGFEESQVEEGHNYAPADFILDALLSADTHHVLTVKKDKTTELSHPIGERLVEEYPTCQEQDHFGDTKVGVLDPGRYNIYDAGENWEIFSERDEDEADSDNGESDLDKLF